MNDIDIISIKEKILEVDPKRWWGDDFDVRFFLISKLNKINNKIILDIGGGIGILSWWLDQSNFKINLDNSIIDLKKCKQHYPEINNICASMTHLPIKNEIIDIIVAANILEVSKSIDLEKKSQIKKNKVNEYPSIEKILNEISISLKKNGKFFITTPNNEYYKGKKLDYFELNYCISNHFKNYQIFFFNTYKAINKKYSKLNLANVIPKIKAKVNNRKKILYSLLKKDNGKNQYSISFYVEGINF